jgi:hypothetical protein
VLPASFLPFCPFSPSFLLCVEAVYDYSLAFREVRITSTDIRRRLAVTILQGIGSEPWQCTIAIAEGPLDLQQKHLQD